MCDCLGYIFHFSLYQESLKPGGILVLAEDGDRWGFHLIRCARSLLIRMETPTELATVLDGAALTPDIEILAPCPHLKECPLKGNKSRWCHFAQQCEAGPTAVTPQNDDVS